MNNPHLFPQFAAEAKAAADNMPEITDISDSVYGASVIKFTGEVTGRVFYAAKTRDGKLHPNRPSFAAAVRDAQRA